jgi:glycogen synthase
MKCYLLLAKLGRIFINMANQVQISNLGPFIGMKIAYISYEYPPHTAYGGIAAYMYHITHAMQLRGHTIEVFCASGEREAGTEQRAGITVHYIKTKDRKSFGTDALPVFEIRHRQLGFDLLESAEFNADGLAIKKAFPALPLVVKFHTPSFFIKHLNKTYRKNQLKERLKKWLGIKQYKKEKDPEYEISCRANALCAPSPAMKEVVCTTWQLPDAAVTVLPNVFLPPDALLQIEPDTHTARIGFIGRLEVRKGIVNLVKALPGVLQRFPEAKMRFIGKPDPAPDGNGLMDAYIRRELSSFQSQLEWQAPVPPAKIPEQLAELDICVFPSLWEAAGYVCLEAMAAARGIVAGNQGGMRDMLEGYDCGRLVDPTDSDAIAKALMALLENKEQRMAQGKKARARVMHFYAEAVAGDNEAFYQRVLVANA